MVAMGSNELLKTKFFIPSIKSNLVKRDRLVKYLHRGTKEKLILISAPAGFGKTILLAQWLNQTALKHTWLSLDERDNDFKRFWTYVIGALQKVQPHLGKKTLEMLKNPEIKDYEYFLTSLIAQITTLATDVILIFDDYHFIKVTSIHQSLQFLLDYLPKNLHLVIASRSDLPLPLARLRARGELSELRARELRFTTDEAQLFAREVMKLNLSEEQVSALQSKAEGWIAGLQMAALSLQECSHISTWIESLQGNQRYIWDYLTEEVLEQQPETLKSFLLQTSILERMTGSLCDAVLESENSTETLNYLDRINLFVIPLDNNRCWYRYHHLFGELLCHYLQKQEPDRVPEYHRRAARWYEQQNLVDEAFKHALAAKDWELAADLIEKDAWTLWFTAGDIAGARQYLEDAERAIELKPIPKNKPSWTNHPLASEVTEFWANIATIKSFLSHEQDRTEAIHLAREALKIVPEYNYWLRSLALMNLGASYYLTDKFEQAEPILLEAAEVSTRCKQADKIKSAFIDRTAESAVTSLCFRAELKELHGEFKTAIAICQEALEISTKRHWLDTTPGIFAQAIMGKLLWQQNEKV